MAERIAIALAIVAGALRLLPTLAALAIVAAVGYVGLRFAWQLLMLLV